MANQQLTNTLAELVRSYAQQGPLPTPTGRSAVAREILNFRPGLQPINKEVVKTEDPRGPSAINRFIDVLSRPLYGITNPIERAVQQGSISLSEIGSEIVEGITGKDKVLGSDILEAAGVESGAQRGVAGFGLDVALDPLTYVGLGLASKLGRGATRSVEALSEVERTSGQAAQKLTQDISEEAAGLSRAPAPDDPARTFIGQPAEERLALPPGPQRAPSPEAPARTFEVKYPTAGQAPDPNDPPRLIAANPQGTAAVVGTAETIATPIPKPVSVRDMLDDLLKAEPTIGTPQARMIQRQIDELTEQPHSPAQRVNVANVLRDLAKEEKSPPVRNMILE